MPENIPLQSTNLDTCHYDVANHELVILFKSGKTYKFMGVPAEIYTKLIQVESPGKFFNQNIKDNFPSVQIKTI